MPADPIARFRRWFRAAAKAGSPLPESMALATVNGRGRPSVRYVLLKHVDARGFVFYTHAGSRKGKELRRNPRAAVAIHWNATGRQVRIEGRVQVVSAAEADRYWATRPRASQLAALASKQSAELESRAKLVELWRALGRRYQGREVPRPPGWVGFVLIPEVIEFWTHREHRLHDREVFSRGRRGWKSGLLQP
jgi:pyridoxamine 5'-phosphate oxidase